MRIPFRTPALVLGAILIIIIIIIITATGGEFTLNDNPGPHS
jgi:hypothetical protein